MFVPRAEVYSESLYLPLICIGLLVGFGTVYGVWHRTRVEWGQILGEGVVPYLLAVAGVYALIGVATTPMVARPMEFIDSIAQVNLIGDGTERIPVVDSRFVGRRAPGAVAIHACRTFLTICAVRPV